MVRRSPSVALWESAHHTKFLGPLRPTCTSFRSRDDNLAVPNQLKASRNKLKMIACLSLLLICQLAGEIVVGAMGLPLPGPVVGLVLLFVLLLTRDRFSMLARGPLRENAVEGTAKGILSHLSLLFIPAGVGVVQKLDVVADHGVATAILLAASVIVTLIMTVAAFLATDKLIARLRQ